MRATVIPHDCAGCVREGEELREYVRRDLRMVPGAPYAQEVSRVELRPACFYTAYCNGAMICGNRSSRKP